MGQQQPATTSKPDSKTLESGFNRSRLTLSPEQIQRIRTIPPVYLNAVEAAVYTDFSERNFRKLADQGVFPNIRVGRRLLFRRAALDDALAKLESNQLTITRRANARTATCPTNKRAINNKQAELK
jgi:excisionase family DNA binding protein